jgi:endonuclease/exonuclease/phosphatase family metal-dependent hydrolase
VHSLDLQPRAELQVAMLYDPDIGSDPEVVVVPNMPRGTRPIASADVCWPGHRLRIYACHWTARFSEESRHSRGDIARYLNGVVYDFLRSGQNTERRHVLIVGDMNEEPFGLLEERFYASRDRASARRREHYTDQDVKRVRLYNCAWRWMGESGPHIGGMPAGEVAGTYFWKKANCWRTLDHVLVDGTLLTEQFPYLDESRVAVVTGPFLLGSQGRPEKFQWNNGKPTGVSDHLPIRGRIVLTCAESHV